MNLTARDQESFYHLIGLLNEAGYDGVPVGGNELVVPESFAVADAELRTEIERTLLPGTNGVPAQPLVPEVASVSPGGSDVGAAPVHQPAGPGPLPGMMGPTGLQRPPRTGPGSGITEQRRYATWLGLQITPDMGRDDIVAAIDNHLNDDDAAGGPNGG